MQVKSLFLNNILFNKSIRLLLRYTFLKIYWTSRFINLTHSIFKCIYKTYLKTKKYLRIDLDPASETCSCLHVTAPNTVHPLSPPLSLSLESTPGWTPCWRSSMMLTEKNMRVFKQCGGLRQQAGSGQPSTLPKQNYSFHCPCTSMNSALNICSVSFSESLTFLCTPGLRCIWTASNRDCSLSP